MQTSKIVLGVLVVNQDKWIVKQVNYVRRIKGITQHIKTRPAFFQISRDKDGLSIPFDGEASLYHFNHNKSDIISAIENKYL